MRIWYEKRYWTYPVLLKMSRRTRASSIACRARCLESLEGCHDFETSLRLGHTHKRSEDVGKGRDASSVRLTEMQMRMWYAKRDWTYPILLKISRRTRASSSQSGILPRMKVLKYGRFS
jgi:hypothetical protein